MKRTIKSSFILALVLLVASPVFAQQRQGDRDRKPGFDREMFRDIPAEVRTEAHVIVFDEYLNLSDSQEQELREIDEDFAIRREQVKEEKVNRRKKMLLAKELRNEHQQAIHEVLTKEQYAVYLDKREAIQYDIRQRLKDHLKNGE